MTLVNMLFDLMKNWSPLGQFVFLCLVGLAALGLISQAQRFLIILVRGYPVAGTPPVNLGDEADAPDESGAPDADRVAPPRGKF